MAIDTDRFLIVSGVAYKKELPGAVIHALETARLGGDRVMITYGDTVSGKRWKKSIPAVGWVGASSLNFPILLHRKRAGGGECIKTSSILEIKIKANGRILYEWSAHNTATQIVIEEPLMNETGLLLPIHIEDMDEEEEIILPVEEYELQMEIIE